MNETVCITGIGACEVDREPTTEKVLECRITADTEAGVLLLVLPPEATNDLEAHLNRHLLVGNNY